MFPSHGAVLCLLSRRSKKVRPPAGTTDALGNVTTYGYNADTNVLDWVQYPNDAGSDRKTKYTYNEMYRMSKAETIGQNNLGMYANYTYDADNDMLASIQTPTTTYNFDYGNFGLRTSVSIGTQLLATYKYTNDENNYLEVLEYGNDDSVLYDYDKLGRLTLQTYEDGDTVKYAYDNNGDLAQVYDSGSGITTKYYYDLIGRAMKYTETKSGYSHSVEYAYDTQNNLSSQTEIINGTEHNTTYTYDDDNRVTSKVTDNIGVYYTYDSFGRLTQQVTKNNGTVVLTETYTYNAGSAQIASHSTVGTNYSVTYSYTYDANGNILTVSDGTNTTSYVYDSANQLIRENNQAKNYTYTWLYDEVGNIYCKYKYSYTTGTLPTSPVDTEHYGHGNGEWYDLLDFYNGSIVEYDIIGNPNGYGDMTFTWEHGRELASVTKGSQTWTYTYDANGKRTQKSNGSTTYTYIYDGDLLAQMLISNSAVSHTMYFTYDAEGIPQTLTFDGSLYYYVTNIQGDVVEILNSSGELVGSYTYNAWGCVSVAGSEYIDRYNPLRYRGYIYDEETGLYYVSSRYYDPEIGRWINADDCELLLEEYESLLQYNLFSYCWNNPVNMFDPDGYWTLALATGGYLATASTVGATNVWNPVGWIVLGTVAVVVVVSVGAKIADAVALSTSVDSDPYARPGQKKQGRERKSKARKSNNWKPRSKPRPPKKHTPGRDHRRYK